MRLPHSRSVTDTPGRACGLSWLAQGVLRLLAGLGPLQQVSESRRQLIVHSSILSESKIVKPTEGHCTQR